MDGHAPLPDRLEGAHERAARPFVRLARLHRYVTAAGAFIAVVMLGLCVTALYEGRQEALLRARDTSRNLLQILEKDISRNVEIYDLSLKWMLDSSQRPDVLALPTPLQREILFDRSTQAKYLGAMLVVDAKGHIVIDSASVKPRKADLSDRDYFTVHRDDPHVGLYLSRPFQSRLRNGEWSVALSRRINNPDGSFKGVALVAISLAYFKDLLAGLDIGPHGVVLLLRDDGSIIIRQPFREADVGVQVVAPSVATIDLSVESGTYVAKGALDGVTRLFSYERVPGLPVVAIVAPAEDDILGTWRKRSLVIGGLMAIFSVAFVGVSMLLARELRQRASAQSRLIEQATHDKLTGVSNRHALDAMLAAAWRKARRDKSSISALFIDIDKFKAYNDFYGHAAGDVALAEVAKAIAASVRRPFDIVGRYGGEEFVVGLPDTPLDGAVRIAEAIREGVQQLAIPHTQHAYGVVTVSVGVASAVPESIAHRGLHQVDALLRLADAALYTAKNEGRNAVRIAATTQPAEAAGEVA
ncbi:GGDEF domain-containing protein [Pararobbsia silviterrae]|uniref:diguanylate cyclase n=1 Tax=Pararobbsia silviterrae TaxID=1792498 RepID=A0A494Y715_9BURK|nr:GGDEF domain-containing protein [Pararobbsia silviterrae]RKP55720.1 diguanylate cyclase [Pararobbsia silviterrae]